MTDELYPNADGTLPDLLSESDLAERWQKSPRSLQRWRAKGHGPAHIAIGGSVRYRLSDVLAFENRMRRGGADTE